MFVARPNAGLRAENKTILILVTDIVVKVLSKTELTMKLLQMTQWNRVSLREPDVSHHLFFGSIVLLTCSKDTP